MRSLWGRSSTARWIVAALFLLLSLSLIGGIVRAAGFPRWIALFPVVLSLYQLGIAPGARLAGLYRYHSPMLKATIRTRNFYELHGGTTFDYLVTFRWRDRGCAAARRIMIHYLEGLIDVAECVARGEIAEGAEITGTSYMFSEQTARRLGFRIRPAGVRLRVNLLLNALDITLLYSFAKGRLAIPNLIRARRAVIPAWCLAAKRPTIEAIIQMLRRRSSQREGDHEALCA